MNHTIDDFPGRKITSNNKEYLYFGGTAYLGVQTDKEFQNILIKNIKKYGSNYGASRKSNIRLSIYEEAENYLANWVGSESCIVQSSGYLAGQLVSGYFNTKAYALYYAPRTHAALYQTSGDAYIADNYTELKIELDRHLESQKESIPVIFIDTIDLFGANYPDFDGLKSLPLNKCIVVADDSHGVGIVGMEGSGAYRALAALHPKELLVCCSLGKAMGLQAGAIFGKKHMIEKLSDTNFFAGASPPAPAYMATLLEAKTIYDEKRNILKNFIALFQSKIGYPNNLKCLKEYPAFAYFDNKLTTYLEKNGLLVSSFKYPSERSKYVNRIVLSAHHKKKDIEYLARCINTLY